ncbi:Deacetylases, including yeast histone deacetylase and acetoin utilization protein [hydrothermal vent metagenome]|uniref:Acetoin utilization protein AcuC n=1 Tax=hydrothermal vent metagenome TaxID=652676 RepID=A0A3B1C476_9ZZZZ
MKTKPSVSVYAGEEIAHYGFGNEHPFGSDRFGAFWREFTKQGLHHRVQVTEPTAASREKIELFHTASYVSKVQTMSQTGDGYLDAGDTPCFPEAYTTTSYVVGCVLDAVKKILRGDSIRAFVPIAGLHHARRDKAAGFCIFNDCGIAIEALRADHGIQRVAYVDIDAHHGDGVFYSFEDDPDLIFADIHEDGSYLYPGTGARTETGKGAAIGTKLNIPLPPEADDQAFLQAWSKVEEFITQAKPEFIILQCGADSIAGDPITHLKYSTQAHAHAAASLSHIADSTCAGRLLAVGGGGYNRDNLARAWSGVVAAMIP